MASCLCLDRGRRATGEQGCSDHYGTTAPPHVPLDQNRSTESWVYLTRASLFQLESDCARTESNTSIQPYNNAMLQHSGVELRELSAMRGYLPLLSELMMVNFFRLPLRVCGHWNLAEGNERGGDFPNIWVPWIIHLLATSNQTDQSTRKDPELRQLHCLKAALACLCFNTLSE